MDLQQRSFYKDLDKKIIIDWDTKFKNHIDCAWGCFALLFELSKMIEYRQRERTKELKRISNSDLRRIIEKKYGDGLLVNSSYNIIAGNQQGWDIHRSILDSKSYPADLEQDLKSYLDHAVFLREAFIDLYDGFLLDGDPLQKLTTTLWDVLISFSIRVRDTYNVFQEKEKIADQNSENASKPAIKNEDYKKHEKYPELERMIKLYTRTPKEVREVNQLIGEILGTSSKVTIRKYRHQFLQEAQK